jgi:hypothetical protein
MAGNHPNNKTPERAKESALSRAFTSTLLRFRHTERSISYSPLICPAALSPLHLFSSGHPRNCSYLSCSPGDVLWSSAFCRGRWLLFLRFFWQFFGGVLRQTLGKPFATWHQFGTKTRCWSGCFPEWRGAKSNGITMG